MTSSEASRAASVSNNDRITSLHIGAAGELLVQYQLLKREIDSARMTTDSGIDLVVYSPVDATATTVQVKTVKQPGPAGGTGQSAVGLSFPDNCRADLLAVALLSTDTVWLFTMAEARTWAQQLSPKGQRKLYWYTDRERLQSNGVPLIATDMDRFLLERRADELFPTVMSA
jgi:hypothetical protein